MSELEKDGVTAMSIVTGQSVAADVELLLPFPKIMVMVARRRALTPVTSFKLKVPDSLPPSES
jgi:hypothetical protein